MAATNQQTIGFVGLGAMGMPMTRVLLAAGFAVRGSDLRQAALDDLAAAGGVACASAEEAARGADVLLLMVVNAAQAEAVLFDGGALEALPVHATVIVTATCPPSAVVALAARVTATGRYFVDAPVSGGVAGAAAGRLTIMAAAPAKTIAAVRPVLDALGGDRVFIVGDEAGQGAIVKTVNQLLCGAHIAVAAEGLALAEKLGMDGRMLLEILGGSAASSWMLKDRGPRMLEDEPSVASAVDIFVKDLGIVMQAGRDAGAALPMAALAHQLFLSTSGRGDGAVDDSQVIRSYRLLNGA